MSKYILKFIITTSIIATAIAVKQKGNCAKPCAGGVWDRCVQCPSPCQPTCKTYGQIRACPAMCVQNGCECADGFVRNDKGMCIHPKYCPSTSESSEESDSSEESSSEESESSEESSSCEESSEELESKPDKPPKKPLCNKSYEKYTNCGSACPKTCDNHDTEQACIKMCMTNTCECETGYVRGPNGNCMLPKHCPVKKTPCNTEE